MYVYIVWQRGEEDKERKWKVRKYKIYIYISVRVYMYYIFGRSFKGESSSKAIKERERTRYILYNMYVYDVI